MSSRISGVAYHLPEGTLTNADLAAEFPEWTVDKIAEKTGIHTRHIARSGELSSDLAAGAAEELFETTGVARESVDYVILCTQSPDFVMPSTSVLVHHRLGLREDAGATDITLGCSGYTYGLGLAKGLIESEQAGTVLLLTADTYSKYVNRADKSVRTLFGDGASATLITDDGTPDSMRGFVYGSDGSGGRHLVVPGGGLGDPDLFPKAAPLGRQLESNGYDLFMDGPAVFNFTIRVAGPSVDRILAKAGVVKDDIDLWVFHQANSYMLGHLRKKLDIPEDKFVISMGEVGNTVSSTIPIALAMAQDSGQLKRGMKVLLLGFGVGLSWGGALIEW